MKKHDLKQRGLPVIHDHAAGIDIGSRFHVVAVRQNSSEMRSSSVLPMTIYLFKCSTLRQAPVCALPKGSAGHTFSLRLGFFH